MKALFLNILVFLCITNNVVAQDFATKFEQIIQKMITEDYRTFSLIWEMKAENVPDSLIPLLKQYETVPNSRVQDKIYQSYFEYGIKSTDLSLKKQMMANLLNACSYPDSVELSYSCRETTELFLYFENKLFDQTIIDTINERIKKNNRFSLDYAYVSGKLYQYQMIPVFEDLLHKETYDEAKYKWRIILARLGHKESIDIIRDSLQKLFIWDRVRKEKIFAYIRQRPILDILLEDLKSDKRDSYYEPWMGDDWVEPLIAYEAMDILTKLIKDFPVQRPDQRDDTFSEEKELAIARAWAKKHKKDYEIIKE